MEVKKKEKLDPTEIFPNEIVEKIFFHLKAYELRMCTFVSQNWNYYIGCSARCMDKFILRLRYNKDCVEPISRDRRYQNITLGSDITSEKLFNSLYAVMKSKRWKLVKLIYMRFESTSSLMKMVKTFEGTVEKLEISRVTIVNQDVEATSFEFKQLKHLKYSEFGANPIETWNMLQNCLSLHSFYFDSRASSSDKSVEIQHGKILVSFLQKQKNLKLLNVEFFSKVENFDPFYSFPFQLEDLAITINSKASNFALSLMHNNAIIKRLALCVVVPSNGSVLRAALGLKSLVEFSIYTDCCIIPDHPYTLSESIQTFRINSPGENDRVRRILASVPKVKHIKLFNVDDELAHFIAENIKNLESLTSCEVDIESVQRILPRVKIFKINWSLARRFVGRETKQF